MTTSEEGRQSVAERVADLRRAAEFCHRSIWEDKIHMELELEPLLAGAALEIERIAKERDEMTYLARGFQLQRDKTDAVATERWRELKRAEKMIRLLHEALKGLFFVVKSEPAGVPSHLRRDIRRAERVLEAVALAKRERRRQ